MMWLRQKVMDLVVFLIHRGLHLEDLHSRLLRDQMAARRAKGVKEVQMGVYVMNDQELEEHAKRY